MAKNTGAATGRRLKRGDASTERLNLRVTPQLVDTLNELIRIRKEGLKTAVCSQADIVTLAVYHYQEKLAADIQKRNAELEEADRDFKEAMAKRLKYQIHLFETPLEK